MEKLLKRISSLVEALKQVKLLSGVHFESEKGLSSGDFADIEEQFSIVIQDEVKAFYAELNGCTLSWEYHSSELDRENNFIEGFVRILRLYEVMSGFDGRLWRNELWHDKTPAEDLQFLKRLKVFDYFGKDNVHCICLEVSSANILTTKLWLFRQGSKPIPLIIQLPEYIDKLLYTKAFWGWQYLYAVNDPVLRSAAFESVKMEIALAIANYRKIFGNDTDAGVIELYESKFE